MEEIWKDISEYEGYYQVSNLGNVRSLPRIVRYKNSGLRKYPGKLLSSEMMKDNYQRVVLMKNGVKTKFRIHRLVATAFIPNVNNKPFINHIDGNKSNNVVNNLEWCTASENIIHADKCGLRDMSKHNPPNSKRIKCIETGKVYVSCLKAVKALGKTSNSARTLSRGTKLYGKAFGLHWEFID